VLVFAHEGGWDEIALVIGPLVAIGALLLIANRRLKARLDALDAAEPSPAESDHATAPTDPGSD
jgi:hypothetical protein